MPAIVDRGTGAVLMLVDDPDDAEAIMIELRRAGIGADLARSALPSAERAQPTSTRPLRSGPRHGPSYERRH